MTFTNENQAAQSEARKPTHSAKVRKGYGKSASFETVGVAWANEDRSLCVQLYGTQIIEGKIYCYTNKPKD